jgi:hypothetical protein
MTSSPSGRSLSRRSAIAGIGAGGLVASLGPQRSGAAQGMTTADHPLTGTWLAMANPARPESPQTPVPSLFNADGTVVLGFVPADINMDGDIQYVGPAIGVWEPYDEQTGHFTAVQPLADKSGAFAGSVTIDGHPHVNEDGMSFIDDGSLVTITIRDPSGAVVMTVPPGSPGRPVTATKMRVGVPGFPGEEDATPVP